MGIAAAAVIPLGLFLRFLPLGVFADLAGGILYAILIYLLLTVIAPRWSQTRCALWALGWCWTVELLQLTGLPTSLAQLFPPASLVFGTGFAALDLLAYAAGALGIWALDSFISRSKPGGPELNGA